MVRSQCGCVAGKSNWQALVVGTNVVVIRDAVPIIICSKCV